VSTGYFSKRIHFHLALYVGTWTMEVLLGNGIHTKAYLKNNKRSWLISICKKMEYRTKRCTNDFNIWIIKQFYLDVQNCSHISAKDCNCCSPFKFGLDHVAKKKKMYWNSVWIKKSWLKKYTYTLSPQTHTLQKD
jgi:hypothetical protein